MRAVIGIFLSVLFAVPLSSTAFGADDGKRIKVVLLNPWSAAEPFGRTIVGAMEETAPQLGIDFSSVPASRPEDMVAEVRKLVDMGDGRPDFLIITVHKGIGTKVLEIAEGAKMPVFLINQGLLGEEKDRAGGPREHYKYWIGQMLPDDDKAGYDLARELIGCAGQAKAFDAKGRIPVVALTGVQLDYAAIMRERGLARAVESDKRVDLLQTVPANWTPGLAESKTQLLLGRYPDVRVIWAANDAMSMGAVAAIERAGRRPGKDVLVGGIDWNADALRAVADGKLAVSVGGHLLEGVWAMVLLCDYYHGIDFASERVDWRSEMIPLTREDVAEYVARLGPGNWKKLDVRRFSKYYNPKLKAYDFSVKALLAGGGREPRSEP